MKKLQGIDVMLVTENLDKLDVLPVWLRSEGALLRTATWSEYADACATPPDVLIADLARDSRAQVSLLLRGSFPVLALVERDAPPLDAGTSVQKQIVKPGHPADIVSAIATLAEDKAERRSTVPSSQGEEFAQALKASAERHDARGLLALVNATGPFRYTSILRFDGEQLTSIWTYDREAPETDAFPTDKTVAASYCSIVRETLKPLAFSDVSMEPSLSTHPARYQVLSYCGVPLLRSDGGAFGTLCQFDVVPRAFSAATVTKLEIAARALQGSFVDAFTR